VVAANHSPLLFDETCHASGYSFVTAHPTSSPTLLMHLLAQAAVTSTTSLCLLFLGRSNCAPRISLPNFHGGATAFTSTSTNRDDWLIPHINGPGADGEADDNVEYWLRPSGLG
jgi:hypothetical protein